MLHVFIGMATPVLLGALGLFGLWALGQGLWLVTLLCGWAIYEILKRF